VLVNYEFQRFGVVFEELVPEELDEAAVGGQPFAAIALNTQNSGSSCAICLLLLRVGVLGQHARPFAASIVDL
jgi:hypothetical protein